MFLRRSLLMSVLISTSFLARAQQPATAAAFVVSQSDTKTVVMSEPFQIDPKASNDQVVAQFAKAEGIEVGTAKWSVIRHADLATAQREKARMEEKYKRKGMKVKSAKSDDLSR